MGVRTGPNASPPTGYVFLYKELWACTLIAGNRYGPYPNRLSHDPYGSNQWCLSLKEVTCRTRSKKHSWPSEKLWQLDVSHSVRLEEVTALLDTWLFPHGYKHQPFLFPADASAGVGASGLEGRRLVQIDLMGLRITGALSTRAHAMRQCRWLPVAYVATARLALRSRLDSFHRTSSALTAWEEPCIDAIDYDSSTDQLAFRVAHTRRILHLIAPKQRHAPSERKERRAAGISKPVRLFSGLWCVLVDSGTGALKLERIAQLPQSWKKSHHVVVRYLLLDTYEQ